MSTHLLNDLRGRIRPQTLFHRGARLASGILLAASVACGGGDSTGPETIEGTYTLQTIDGRQLPVVLEQDANEKDEITAGGITLSKGAAFTVTVTIRVTIGAQVSTETNTLTGTWSRSGTSVTLNTGDEESTSAVVSGRTLTLVGDAGVAGVATWVFRK